MGGVFAFGQPYFVRFGTEVLFEGSDNSGNIRGLWVTDGTSGGTSEISVAGAHPGGIFFNPPNFFVLGSEVLFEGFDAQSRQSLWVTDGTSAGTSELTIAGANQSTGLFVTAGPGFGRFGSEALFNGMGSDGRNDLWVTDGTAAGTSEISVAGSNLYAGLTPSGLTQFTQSLVRPVLSNVPASDSYTERAAPVALAPSLHVTDDNSATLTSATVAITGGTFANDGDALAVNTAGTSITAAYDSASETLTLTGTDTLADYQAVLQTITFANPNHNPTNFGSNSTRTLTWVVNDGAPSSQLSAPQTTTLSIASINDSPTLSNVAAGASFTEDGGAITLANALTVTDPDNLNLVGATVSVAGGKFTNDMDVLAATGTASITVSYNSTTETLTLTGTDTLVHYQAVLDAVTFSSGDNPTGYGSNPTRTVTWVLDDGAVSNRFSAAQTTTIALTGINDAPTLSNVPTTVSAINGRPTDLARFLSVSDPDNLTLAGATVAITGGAFAGDGDVLTANTSGTAITASYNVATETLSLSGTDTLAHYQSVLDSVALNSAVAGTNPTRTLTWVVNDGGGSNNLSAAATTTVTILPPQSARHVLFRAYDASGFSALWVTDGTSAGTSEISVSGANGSFGLNPSNLASVGSEVLFSGVNAANHQGLWATDGTSAGTFEISVPGHPNLFPSAITAFGSKALFNGGGLWVTDGTTAGTSEISVTGAGQFGLNPKNFAVFGSEALFAGESATDHNALWVTNGTSAGTSEISVAGAAWFGLSPSSLTPFGSEVLFAGYEAVANPSMPAPAGLWVTNGTSAGTSELSVAGASTSVGLFPAYLTVFGSKVLFAGEDASDHNGLWITDGTAAGTSEISVAGAYAGSGGLAPSNLVLFGNHVLFNGVDASGHHGLWVTDGTSAGTSELSVAGAGSSGVDPQDLTVFGNSVLFEGQDPSGHYNLWRTDGTSAGTSEIAVAGGSSSFGLAPSSLASLILTRPNNDFTADGVGDVLWRNTSGEVDTWLMNNGRMAGGTVVSLASSVWQFAGAGDLTGTGTSDVLWQNATTGEVDTWLINNGHISGGAAVGIASSAWQPLGTGDFNGDTVSDVLWRNTASGAVDTWIMTNGHVTGGAAVGSVSSAWQFAGIGDFDGDGSGDVLWHNAATGAVESWLITNGHVTGGGGVGTASSAWQSLGAGDFNNDGTSDVLWRNLNTGEVDTWLVNNGRMVGGAVLGSVSSAWQFAGIGDFTGTGTSDVLWRNLNTGEVDTWLITNDQLTGGAAIGTASSAWQPQVIHTG
jgi:ELWxxDGT repeat protein